MTMPIYDMARASGQESRIGEINPLGRGGEPEEIAPRGAVPRFRRIQLCQRLGDRRPTAGFPLHIRLLRRFDLRML
jgi:hypothetical protein